MVTLPTSPTLVSPPLPTDAPLFPTLGPSFGPSFARAVHTRDTSRASSLNSGSSSSSSSSSSPSLSSSPSPRFPCMNPVSGRVAHSPSVTISSAFPIPVSHQFPKKSSSSIPSLPEQHYSSMQVKGSTTSLDQAILPIKTTLSKLQEHDNYFDQPHQQRQEHHHRRRDHNASSTHTEIKQHSRIDIANLLCTSDSANTQDSQRTGHQRQDFQVSRSHTQQRQHHQRPRAFTEEADDQDVPSHNHYSNGNGNSLYSSHSTTTGASHEYSRDGITREPGFGQRDMDTTGSSPTSSSSGYRPSHPDRSSYSTMGSRPASFSAASSASSVPSYSTSSSPNPSSYSSAPRSLHPAGPQHRSASWNTDRYQDYNQSYEEQRRNDRSNSIHQQNYGPYLNPAASPSSTLAVHHKNHSTEGSSSSSSSSSSYSRIPPTDSSAPLYYPAPHHPPSTCSTSTSYPYHSSHIPRPTNGSSSSARSIHDYGHASTGDSSSDQLRRQSHGPLLPPPTALLSSVAEDKPPRVYGRDSTVDDNWPPLPRATRVVPIDAPNENRSYAQSSSNILPPPYSSSSSSAHRSYTSNYSNGSAEPKPRRVYGIDAADIPSRLPPPAPSASYGSSQYSKPLQHIPDDPEGEEARRRSMGQDSTSYSRHYGNGSSMNASHGAHAYGHPAPSSHHRYQSSEADRPRYDYDNRGWKSSQPQSPPTHTSSSTPTSASASRPPYTASQPYSRPQSPVLDIQPPSWYQHYAHSVTPKGQSQPSYHSDSSYYSNHSHHHHHRPSSGGYNSNGYHESEAMDEYDLEDEDDIEHRLSSKRSSKTALNDGQSVHPFDTPELKSKSKKPKRIKNPGHDEDLILLDNEVYAVKAKRKRANASQLSVLNAAFERSYFPSTEERLRLSKQCRMCPRTVQIWFQNKRQSVKAKTEAMEAAVAAAEGRRASGEKNSNDGQKRSVDTDMDRRRSSGGHGSVASAEAIISALDIQLDGRSVDYFSRKRRATIAKMELNEQQKQKQQQKQEQGHSEQQQHEQPLSREESVEQE